jgi:hypothetical protein
MKRPIKRSTHPSKYVRADVSTRKIERHIVEVSEATQASNSNMVTAPSRAYIVQTCFERDCDMLVNEHWFEWDEWHPHKPKVME